MKEKILIALDWLFIAILIISFLWLFTAEIIYFWDHPSTIKQRLLIGWKPTGLMIICGIYFKLFRGL